MTNDIPALAADPGTPGDPLLPGRDPGPVRFSSRWRSAVSSHRHPRCAPRLAGEPALPIVSGHEDVGPVVRVLGRRRLREARRGRVPGPSDDRSIVGTREDPTQVFSLLALAHGSKVIPSVCQRPFASGDGPSNMET